MEVLKMNKQRSGKLPLSVKFGYGAAEGANSLTFTLFYAYGMFFFTDVVGLSPAFAGMILAVGTIWNAVCGIVVGVFSDSIKWKWGRRRPFILGMAVPFGLFSWLMFTDFKLSPILTEVYFFIMVLVYWTVFTLLEVPYTALAGEMTQDYDERTSLNGWRAGWSQVAAIIGAGTPLIMAGYFGEIWGGKHFGWSFAAFVYGLASVPLILIAWKVTKGRELFPEETKVHIKDVWYAVFKNRSFPYIMAVYAFALIAMTIAGSVGVYFMTYLMGFSHIQISIAFLILFGLTVFWIPVIDIISERLGKRVAWMIFMGMWAFVHVVLIQFVVQPGNIILFYIGLALASGGAVAIYQLGWSMIPDCVEVDEYKTGHRREGLYYGVASLAQKAGCSLSLWIVGVMLSLVGYAPNATQSQSALSGIRSLYGIGVGSFLILSVIVAYFVPMTKMKHTALRECITLRKEGKEYDEQSIKDIIR
jgi:sugar (glycoside-pentoside-hexuronide) transporter